MEINEVITKYGAIGSHIHKLSNAEDDRVIKPFRKVKSISHETTFEKDTNDEDFLKKHSGAYVKKYLIGLKIKAWVVIRLT